MRLIQARLSKAQLDQLAEDEQIFFVQLAHLLNELAILVKCIIFSYNSMKPAIGPEKTVHGIQTLFFVKVLAGKLLEGWKMIKKSYYDQQLSKKYESSLPDNAKMAINKLKDYFKNKNNLVHIIRNRYAFHYDRQKVKEGINGIQDDNSLTMFIAEGKGNNIYAFGDLISNSSILTSINQMDHQAAMDRLFDEITMGVCQWFQDFGHEFIALICSNLHGEIMRVEVDLLNAPLIDSIHLPFFAKRNIVDP